MAQSDSLKLVFFICCWYLGNVYYNQFNKDGLEEAGGKDGPHAYTIAAAQLIVGSAWAVLLWTLTFNPIAFSRQIMPKLPIADCVSVFVLAVWSAFAHLGSVLCMNAGSVSFGQIVKAGEPVFAATVNTIFYKKPPSMAKALMLPVIVLGVAISCLKKDDKTGSYKIQFEVVAVLAGSFANLAAAFKGSENARVMSAPGLKERIGGVGNQFALAQVFGAIALIPIALVMEGSHLLDFFALVRSNPSFTYNLVMSGLTFYWYNEFSTMTLKLTGAITASVANTAKRVVVIVAAAIARNEQLTDEQKLGSVVAIGGVFLYSVADQIFAKKEEKKKA